MLSWHSDSMIISQRSLQSDMHLSQLPCQSCCYRRSHARAVATRAALNACLVQLLPADFTMFTGRCDLQLPLFWRRMSQGRSTRWLAAGPADLPCSSSARRRQWPSTPRPLSFLADPTCYLHSRKKPSICSFIHLSVQESCWQSVQESASI